MALDKVVVVTRKTALEELIERYNTREQARFYIEHMGASFQEYEDAHADYTRALAVLRAALPAGTRCQTIERSFLPAFQFGEGDLVVTLGPDGLVVNTAKYLSGQPLLAFNPDPRRVDGVLIPFAVEQAPAALRAALHGDFAVQEVTMARASLNDGQSIYAVNDLFVGQRSHISARYRLQLGNRAEEQSSSGIIISTGAGSTGWLRSILAGASGIVEQFVPETEATQVHAVREQYRFDWTAEHLYYTVREPFISKVSGAGLVFGKIQAQETLEIESHMTGTGVIFSDGVEEDYLQFNSGAIARIGVADRTLRLVTRV